MVIGVWLSVQQESRETCREKRKPKQLKYCFQGEGICYGTFCYINYLGVKAFKLLKKRIVENGAFPHITVTMAAVNLTPFSIKMSRNVHSSSEVIVKSLDYQYPALLHGRADMPTI